jgi:hypothetical protein
LTPCPQLVGSQSGGEAATRVEVLVAAWDAPGARPSEQVPRLRSHLQQIGYSIDDTRAGLLATADARTLDSARRNPAALHQLAAVMTCLTYLAEALGRVPVAAMP